MRELFKDNYSDSILPPKLEESNLGDMKCVKKSQELPKNLRIVQLKYNALVLVWYRYKVK